MQTLKPLLIALCLGATAGAYASGCGRAARLDEEANNLPATERAVKLAQALAICPDANIGYRLAVARLEAQNDPPDVLQALARAQESLDPLAPGAKRLLAAIEGRRAQAYFAQEDIPKALAHIEAAFEKEGATELPWLWQIRKAVDSHPKRQLMSQADIERALVASRSAGAVVKIDLLISFDTDQDHPNASGAEQTRVLGRVLTNLSDEPHEVLIIGHTDKRADEAYNEDLSRRRAEQVAALLVKQHPELQGKLKTKGKGESQPRYPGDTDEDYRLNRRVETRILR